MHLEKCERPFRPDHECRRLGGSEMIRSSWPESLSVTPATWMTSAHAPMAQATHCLERL